MAFYKEDILDIELSSGSIARSFLHHTIGSGDQKANRFGVRLFRDGEPVSAESATVTGLFMAPDGTRYVISETSFPGSTGTEGNKAYVQLPGICYAVTGQFTLAIKLSGGGVEGTMRIIDGTVDETGEAGAVVPTSTIPATADIIAAYEEAVAVMGGSVRFDAAQSLTSTQKATARGNIGAADAADVTEIQGDITDIQGDITGIQGDITDIDGNIAPEFSASASYLAGQFVTYNGKLYRFTESHTEAAWNGDDAEIAVIGRTMTELGERAEGGYNQAPKRMVLADYTMSDGVLRTTTGAIDTSEAMYKRISCAAEPGKAYYVGGYNYGWTYRAVNFLDSDGKIVGHSKSIFNSENFIGTVVAPNGAATLVVNVRADAVNPHPMFIYEFADEMTFTQEIGTDIKDAGGAITFDSAWNATTNAAVSQPAGTYLFRTLTISGGERFIVDGFNASENYPVVIFQDSNGNVIFNMFEAQRAVYGYAITAPATAKKMIVNGRTDRNAFPVIRKVISRNESAFDALFKEPGESAAELVSIFPTFVYDNVVKTRTGTNSATNDVYLYCSAAVTPGADYIITGWHYSDNYPLYIFMDANNKPCGVPEIGSLSGNAQQWRVKAQAPLDAVSVYVNARKGGNFGGECDIQTYGVQKIRDALKLAQTVGMYTVHSPIADLISSSAKSEYYLSKFSYAYAVMLHRIMTTYPNALVICCSCNECERTMSTGLGMPEMNKVGETIADYNAVIELMCKAFGAVFVDHHSCGITYYNISNYLQDYNPETGFGVHPNAAGMALIAAKTIKDLTGYDFTGKKLSVYGDSISTYNGTGSEHNQYPNGDVNNVNKTWWHISMIQHFGMTLLNNGSAGSRSVSTIREGIEGYPKSGVEQDRIDNLAVNGVSPDVIIIKQGINDFGNAGSANNADLSGHYHFGGI